MPTQHTKPAFHFVLVSPDRSQSGLLKALIDKAFSTISRCHDDLPLKAMLNGKSRHCSVYLLDCMHIGVEAISAYLDPDEDNIPDHIYIALYNIENEDSLTPLVKQYKIRGIFSRNCTQSNFIKGLKTIINGNLWLTRRMLSNCIQFSQETENDPVNQIASSLSKREIEILQHVLSGESNQAIADTMQISQHTVKTHLYNIYKKINVRNRLQAIQWAANALRDYANN